MVHHALDLCALGQVGLYQFHLRARSAQFGLQCAGHVGRALVMAPHAPARRRKLADDLCAQALSASGDQNLFHEVGCRPNRGNWKALNYRASDR